MGETTPAGLTPPVTTLPVPKTNEELRIFMILSDNDLKTAYKDYLLQTTLNATREEVSKRTVDNTKTASMFKTETLI